MCNYLTMNDTEIKDNRDAENNSLSSEERKEDELCHRENQMQGLNSYFSWYRKINLTVEPVLCAMFISLNLCDIVITNLIMYSVCKYELNFNKTECDSLGTNTVESHRLEALVQPYASFILTCKNLISSILPAIMSLFLGPWSDYHGRKFLILASTLGLSISLLLYAVLSYVNSLGPLYFLLAALPFSLSGGFINLILACYSYISDISTEENCALRLSLLESSFYMGTLIGITSSYYTFNIDKDYGYIITFSIGALISLAAFLYAFWFVIESVQRSEESQISKALFQVKFLKESFATSFKRRENYGRAVVCLSMFSMVNTIVVLEGENNLMYLFTRIQFNWDLHQFSTWFSITIAIHFTGLVLGSMVLTKFLKISDALLAVISHFMNFGQHMLYVFIPIKASSLMYWGQMIGFLGGLSGPALKSVISKTVPKEDVGKVFSLVTSFESLFPLLSTPLYTALYNSTINFRPGLFFVLSSSLFFLNFVFCCVICAIPRCASSQNYAHLVD